MHSRGLVSGKLEKFHLDLPRTINGKYSRTGNIDTPVRERVRNPVSESSVERVSCRFAKQSLYIAQTCHLEDFRFAHDNLAREKLRNCRK